MATIVKTNAIEAINSKGISVLKRKQNIDIID